VDQAAARRARFEAEVLPHHPAAYRMARRLTRSATDAEDVVQEACLRAFRTFDAFAAGTNGKAWLLTIVYSVFVNRYRQELRAPSLLPGDEIDERYAAHVEQSAVDPVRSGAWAEPAVERALDDLPDAFRDAVLLVDVEELSYEEAAVVVGCPVGTLRSRLHRGRKVLMLSLAEFARRSGYLTPGGKGEAS
jgi:RNA polymerase sigma-70 factor (ECF subfamily)